jgi:hypothetical protein
MFLHISEVSEHIPRCLVTKGYRVLLKRVPHAEQCFVSLLVSFILESKLAFQRLIFSHHMCQKYRGAYTPYYYPPLEYLQWVL